MKIKIRVISNKDIDSLSQLVLGFKNEHSRMIGGKKTIKLKDALREVKQHIQRKNTGYFVAVNTKNQLIGFRRWELLDGFYFTRELYIIPQARKQGVAKLLIRHFEKWLLQKNQSVACISCTPHNLAMIMLARSEGYQILNTIEMRKDLITRPRKPRNKTQALGLYWEVL